MLFFAASLVLLSSCEKKKEYKTTKVTYYGIKPKVSSHDGKWHIVETFRTSALTDSTIGRKSFLMFLSDDDYQHLAGRLLNDQIDFSITASNFITRISDTVYIPIREGVESKPYYIVGNLTKYGEEITRSFRGKSKKTDFSSVTVSTLDGEVGAMIQNHYLTYTNIGCLLIAKNDHEHGFNYYDQIFPVVNHADFHGYPQGYFGGF